MKKTCLVLLGCLAVSLPACSSKPRDLIVGKWKTTDSKNVGLEFTRNEMSIDTGVPPSRLGLLAPMPGDSSVSIRMEFPMRSEAWISESSGAARRKISSAPKACW